MANTEAHCNFQPNLLQWVVGFCGLSFCVTHIWIGRATLHLLYVCRIIYCAFMDATFLIHVLIYRLPLWLIKFVSSQRSDYLRREILKMIRDFPNAAIAPWNMATIWGGASLLKMLLRCMSDLLSKKEWKWDFFINLSGSDFPIK